MPRIGSFRAADLRQARDFAELRAALDAADGPDLAFLHAPRREVDLVPGGLRRGENLFGPGRPSPMADLYPTREVASVLLHEARFVASSMAVIDRQHRVFFDGIANLVDPKRLARTDANFSLDDAGELVLAPAFEAGAEHLDLVAIPVCGPGFPNYGHFLFDGLPAIFAHRELLDDPRVRIVGQPLASWQRQILEALDMARCYLEVRRPAVFAKTLATTLLAMHVSHPTPLIAPMFEALRARFGGSPAPAGRRVFFSRGGAGRRLLRNHAAVAARMARLGFEVVQPERLSFREQIGLMSGCAMVVAESGAAMANLGFCPPGAAVLELQPERFAEDWTRAMCCMLGHRWHVYFAAVAAPAAGAAAEAERARQDDFSYEIELADLELAVREVEMRNEIPRAPADQPAGAMRPAGPAPDPAVALRELRRCLAAGQRAAARQICETVFAPRPDYADEHGHPVYLTESLRIALADGDQARARALGEALQGKVAPGDPIVQVLTARHLARQGDREAAREQWRAALARDPNLAEAKVWLAAASEVGQAPKSAAPGTRYGGVAAIAFQNTTDLAGFARSGRDERLALFASLAPPAQLPLHDEAQLDAALRLEHHRVRAVPEAAIYAVTGCQLSAIGLLTRGHQFFFRDDCLPNYFLNWLSKLPNTIPLGLEGSLGLADAEVIRIDQPVACAFHPNVVWGHFLVEILPRLFLLNVLARLGRPVPLAAPSDAPEWVKRFAVTYGTAGGLIWYDPKRHRLEAPVFVVPNMMQVDWALSPMFNLMVSDLLARCGIAEAGAPEGPRLLYLSRARITWAKRLQNEPEVEEMLRGLGFAVVHPETLPIPEQLRVLRAAEVIVAEYGSALHNTLFARPGTRVVSINRHNWLQGEIARIRRQTLAYVSPADGVWRDASKQGEARNFSVEIATLRRVVQEMLEPATRQ